MATHTKNRQLYLSGYRRDEEVVKLVKRSKPANHEINAELNRPASLSKKDVELLLSGSIADGFILDCDAPEPFPYLKWFKPKGAEWQAVEHNISESELAEISGTNLVELATNHKLVFKPLGAYKAGRHTAYLEANITGRLKTHLADGYCACVRIMDGNMTWMPVPSYYAWYEWRKHQREYEAQVCDWKAIMGRGEQVESFEKAIRQHETFKKLDFDWCVSTHNLAPNMESMSHSGKALEKYVDADDKTLHIIVLEADQTGRMLCKFEDTPPSQIADVYSYDCYAGDILIKKIPYKVTCPSCHMAAVNFICDKEELN